MGTRKGTGNFDTLIKEMAKIYRDDTADGMFAGGYARQRLNPAFIKMMTINCMVMDCIHQCGKGGCVGCVADDLYSDISAEIPDKLRWIINETRRIIANRHGIDSRIIH